MGKIQRMLGLGVLGAMSLAVVTTGTGHALPPEMEVSVSGSSVTISGACFTEAPSADGWYSTVGGHEPEEIGKMSYANGTWSITFPSVKQGVYEAVMGCGGETETAVRHFVVI
ncbi:hypothetical protein [Allokutzneria sp. NRRL B-24872]|uniref:hypothetical protein n=1 Tax=Allokutzneria sp. NRRL B-24872 TaxID=1137961 RepID=UPI000A3B05C2|nr:hypothetical protein [Allokutzneria sp. NRRL B-24872]